MTTKRPTSEVLKAILPEPSAGTPRGSKKAKPRQTPVRGFRNAELAAPDGQPAPKRNGILAWANTLPSEADIRKRDAMLHWANTLLFEAVARRNIPGIESALERGADINARDKLGRTPLMHAAFDMNQKIERFLIRKGASSLLQDIDGHTADFMAIRARILKGIKPSNASEDAHVFSE